MTISPNIVITMAGSGERFRRRGYDLPKFQIPARGRPLFDWALASLKQFTDLGGEVVFIARHEHQPYPFVAARCAELGLKRFRVVCLDAPTDGQATTALAAKRALDDRRAPIAIYNIDTFVDAEALDPATVRGEGWIPCFPAEGDAWSFASATAEGAVLEVREKRRISSSATIGLYWFASFDLFEECYQEHFRMNPPDAGERYIAPMYNTLVAQGRPVFMHLLPPGAIHPLGTPEEVERFCSEG